MEEVELFAGEIQIETDSVFYSLFRPDENHILPAHIGRHPALSIDCHVADLLRTVYALKNLELKSVNVNSDLPPYNRSISWVRFLKTNLYVVVNRIARRHLFFIIPT